MKRKILVVKEGGGGFSFETKCLLEKIEDDYDLYFLVPQDREKNETISSIKEFEIPKITSIYDKSYIHTILAFLKCILATINILWKSDYHAVICIGSSVAVPVFIASRFCGLKTVFIESITRINNISKTTSLLLKLRVCDRIYVQWKPLACAHSKLIYKGSVL